VDNSLVLNQVTWKNQGIYPLRIELVDQHGIKSEQYEFKLIISIKEDIEEIEEIK